MRLGFDGLTESVRPLFAVEPYAVHVYVFQSKTDYYLMALCWDDGGMVLTPSQFALLIEAMDWPRMVSPQPPRLPA